MSAATATKTPVVHIDNVVAGYLPGVRALCTARNVLFVADEIQSGLGRTGRTFAIEHEEVVPDMYLLGKALGGGIVPVSAVAANADVLGVLKPGEHGSTFGGNPLACAVGAEVVRLLETGEFQKRSEELGDRLHAGLNALIGQGVVAVRGRGLWAGVDIDPALTQSLLDKILDLKDEGMTVLFVEHDMHMVRHVADWVIVMAEGRVVAEGDPHSVMRDPAVIDAYLGAHQDVDLGVVTGRYDDGKKASITAAQIEAEGLAELESEDK